MEILLLVVTEGKIAVPSPTTRIVFNNEDLNGVILCSV